MSNKTRKIIRITLSTLVIVLVLTVVIIYFSLNSIIASGITSFGTQATGTKVEVSSVNISPFSGTLKIKGLCVANPKNYHSENAFAINSFYVNMNLKSIFSDKIIINEVLIEDVTVDFEPSISKGSNLQEINDNISAYTASGKTPSREIEQKPGKKVVVKHLLIQNGMITVSSNLIKTNIKVPMLKIEINDIGEGRDTSVGEVFQEVYIQMLEGISSSVSGIEGISLDSIKNLDKKDINDKIKSLQSTLGL